ncbi:MAG: hypothetical protein M4579_006446 [Chaenotheca gracillima]|nr:MAG: hypothetical protein M4579_006446 [Chaenotheca gracillima]
MGAAPITASLVSGQPTLTPGAEAGDSLATSSKILNIIYKYRLTKLADAHDKWIEGTPKFLHTIGHFVKAQKTIRMCLPAFPFKSANHKSKVLGPLPDKAEEIALARLNTMCTEIGLVYKPGAKLLLISDGLVYNDLLTIPDKDVWAYGEELRAIAARTCEHIEFSRLRDLVDIQLPTQLEEITYVANASNFRRALLNQFGRDGVNIRQEILENEDTRLTYCGYTRFLENDLRHAFPLSNSRSGSKYRRDVKFVAREMIGRGIAFAGAVKKNFPDYLRLSIHQSTGEHKISLSLLPTKTSFTTPWHCSVAFRADGTLTSGPRGQFEADPTFEIAYVDGRASYFREKKDSDILSENRG